MSRAKTTRRRTARKTDFSPRDFVLAGLGAVSLGRKQALKSIDGLAELPDALRQRADAAARDAGTAVAKLRKQAKTKLAPVKKQAASLAKQAQAEFETRFAPVLARLGAKPKAKRPARKATRKARPSARKATRKRA